MSRQTLLIDADDTLWENNVFFERTIEKFIDLLEPTGFPRDYCRRILNETEKRNIRQHGYGVQSFGRSLEETYLKLTGHMARREVVAQISLLVAELETVPPRILEGVPETLAYLAPRHRLILFTKGQHVEQAGKVEKSGLQGFFEVIEITAEKDVATYKQIVEKHRIVKDSAWMIGNSPRSDVNPAMDAGLNAVFIPHAATWELEKADVRSGGGRLLILSSFRELRQHF
jgi:putative hydrolase of the HAD superfamily